MKTIKSYYEVVPLHFTRAHGVTFVPLSTPRAHVTLTAGVVLSLWGLPSPIPLVMLVNSLNDGLLNINIINNNYSDVK